MTDSNGTRLSIPVHAPSSRVDEEALRKHSFDLIFFPAYYLARKVPPRVRVEVLTDLTDASDVGGWFEDENGAIVRRYATFIADEFGCLTDSDDLYRALHAAFAATSDGLRYVGFFRCGRPPYAPLFALAMLYTKYGRGLYKVDEFLPIPWPALTMRTSFTLR